MRPCPAVFRTLNNRSLPSSAGAASCIAGPADVADVVGDGLFSLSAWRMGIDCGVAARCVGATGPRNPEFFQKKCGFAVDDRDPPATLPARLKRDSPVARQRNWFWPEFGTANWNSILSRFITP